MRANGSSTARGYGQAHRKATEAMRPVVEAGGVRCVRCGATIVAGLLRRRDGKLVRNWVLDHNDDRSGYLGAAHLLCNAKAAARKVNAARARRPVLRSWGAW